MTRREVLWTETAQADLEHVVSFIAEDDIASALAVAERVQRRYETQGQHPERGRVVPELRAMGTPTHRELIEGPWRIVYRYDERGVSVVSVLDGRRDLSSLLLERLVR